MQERRVVGVGMPGFDHDKVTSFEIDHISLKLVGNHQAIRDLAREAHAPEVCDIFRRGLLPHDSYGIGC
jgi:hypothetical protein